MEQRPYSFLSRDYHDDAASIIQPPSATASVYAWGYSPSTGYNTPRRSRDVMEFESYYRQQLQSTSSTTILPHHTGHHVDRKSMSQSLGGTHSTTTLSKPPMTMQVTDSPARAEPPQPPQPMPVQMSKLHEIAFIMNVCLAQFLALGGLAQTVAPMYIISSSFGITEPGAISWYTAAFSLAVGTFILPAGRLGDIYGHKKIFMIGWIWYAIASIITGFSYAPGESKGSLMLSIMRGFQGLGPAVTVPNAMALIGTTFPPGMKKAVVFSLFGACGPTGFVFGAIFSALLSQFGWWPWCFWAMAMVSTFICIISLFIIPTPAARTSTTTFDYAGALTGVTGLILVNFALNQAPLVGWSTQYIPLVLVMGILLLGFFVYLELHQAKHPLVPLRGFKKEAALALACIAVGWSSHGIWLYYFFDFVMSFRGATAISAASQIVPVAVLGPICALSTGFLMKKIRVAYIMLLAMLCFTIGMLFLMIAPPTQPYLILTFWSVIVMPGGMNWSFPSGSILLSNAMPKEHQGMAASLVSTVVNYSISLGLGIAGTANKYVAENHGKLAGLRAGWYLGLGLDVLGLFLASYFVWKSRAPK